METERAVYVLFSCGHRVKRMLSKLSKDKVYCFSCTKLVTWEVEDAA